MSRITHIGCLVLATAVFGPTATADKTSLKARLEFRDGTIRLRKKTRTTNRRATLELRVSDPETVRSVKMTVRRNHEAAISPQLVAQGIGFSIHREEQSQDIELQPDGSAAVGLPLSLCENDIDLAIARDDGQVEAHTFQVIRRRKRRRSIRKRTVMRGQTMVSDGPLNGKRDFVRRDWAREKNGRYTYFIEFENPNKDVCLEAEVHMEVDYNVEVYRGIVLSGAYDRLTSHTGTGSVRYRDTALRHTMRLAPGQRERFEFFHEDCQESPYEPLIMPPFETRIWYDNATCPEPEPDRKPRAAPDPNANPNSAADPTSTSPQASDWNGDLPGDGSESERKAAESKASDSDESEPSKTKSVAPSLVGNWHIGRTTLTLNADGTGEITNLSCRNLFEWKRWGDEHIRMKYTERICKNVFGGKVERHVLRNERERDVSARAIDGGELWFNDVYWKPGLGPNPANPTGKK